MTGSRAAVFPLPPRGSPTARLNAICPTDLPSAALAGAQDDDWVLDPFCGSAAPLFAARLGGLGSVAVAGYTRPSPSSFRDVHDSEGDPSYSVGAELVQALAGQHQNRTTDAA